jgi:hypothetical protein
LINKKKNLIIPSLKCNCRFKQLIDELKDYEAILFHKNVAHCQRIAYNEQHKSVEDLFGKILIEVDFKQKIVIGMSPRQISSEYYDQTMRSCLGNLFL